MFLCITLALSHNLMFFRILHKTYNVRLYFAIIFFLKIETPIIENHSSQQAISEISTIPCPRIDTQQLDRQIKAIMKEVIPFLKVSNNV